MVQEMFVRDYFSTLWCFVFHYLRKFFANFSSGTLRYIVDPGENNVVSQESATKEKANASGETEDAGKMKERPLLWEYSHNNVCTGPDDDSLL